MTPDTATVNQPTADPSFCPSHCYDRFWNTHKPTLRYRGGDVKAWQRKLRAALRRVLALDAMPKPVPLKPKTLWTRQHELGTISKIVFIAEPGVDVPAYLCLPRQTSKPYPAMICLHGHTTGMHLAVTLTEDEKQPLPPENDRDFALWAMRNGFAALCIEQRAFGQRRISRMRPCGQFHLPLRKTTCEDAYLRSLMLGRTLIGERVYDVSRGIDYLRQRGDINMKRIGIMGNSGGGTVTIYAAAVLKELAFAMPACSFCPFVPSIMVQTHCCCNYLPGILPLADMGDILGCLAPKPVVVVNGALDSIFPIGPAQREFAHLKKIYKAAGAADNCKMVVGPGDHRFYGQLAYEALMKLLK